MKLTRLHALACAAVLCTHLPARAQAPASGARLKKPNRTPVQHPSPEAQPAELKRPPPAPVETPPVPTKAPERVVEQSAPGEHLAQVGATLPAEPRGTAKRLVLSLAGGVTMPNAVFRVGPVTTLTLQLQPAPTVPLRVGLVLGFEAHAGAAARTFNPPNGGYDSAALDNQLLVPIELGVVLVPWASSGNEVTVGVAYGALVVMTQASWLGLSRAERGMGHQFAVEVGYARAFGALELSLKARYAVRRTVVGTATSEIELPWYQLGGVALGLGCSL